MQTKTLLGALAALSACFIGFLWWVYFSSAGTLPLAVPICGSLLPLVLVLAFWGVRLLTARRAALKLEHAIADDGAREQREASQVRGAEVDRLRGEFERAVKALKASKLASGSRRTSEAMYRLPWYAIIGPPASGKTTALRNSGLKFPYLPGTGDRLKGIGGTRHCDWWLTNHAILLDTAGRWSVDENERDEWLVFLDLLKKHRGDRPLNGIIAAVSIAGDPATSISGAAEDELREIALRMRERLDEITGRLGVALPVYLLFTKCDLLNGFVESFGNMSSEQRRQIWGFTAPLLQGVRRDPGAYFAQQFELLVTELEQRAVVRMGHEVSPQVIPTIYEFPAQFAALKERLTLFVDELFDASAYRETPLLRGAYFTSGTQEGAPADLLFEDIAGALKLRPPQYESREEKKGYFLHDMLLRVVVEDRALATTSEHELLRQHWKRRVSTSALFVAAALGTTLTADACQRNLQDITRTEAALAHNQSARKQTAGSAEADARPQHSAELLALEQDFARYELGSDRVDLGLYQGERVSPALERYYRNALVESIVRPLLNQNHAVLLMRTQQLQVSAGARHASELAAGAREELRDALSLHLLLTTPREGCTPKLLARQDFIRDRLLALWDEKAVARAAPERTNRRQLISRAIELMSREASGMNLVQDARAIEQARRALGDDDQVERLLARVIAEHAQRKQTLAQIPGLGGAVQARVPLSAAFTLEAWTQITRQVAAADFHENDGDWVFGCGASRRDDARAELDLETFRQNYLKRYEQAWRDFLGGLAGRAPGSLPEAENMLNELVSQPGVLGTLLQNVGDNTDLPLAANGGADSGDAASAQLKAALSAGLRATEGQVAQGGAARALATGAAKQLADDKLGRTDRAGLPLAQAAGSRSFEPLRQAFADFASFGHAETGAPSALEQYRHQLEPVLAALKAYRQDDTKLEALSTATLSALDGTELLLRRHSGSWTPRLRELLVPVLAGVLDLSQRGRGTQLGRAYCDAVYAPFQRELAGRFPLKPDSWDPASLAAFTRFFQPGSGSLWSFQAAHLGGYVSSEGGRFRFSGTHARGLLRDELLDFLQRSAAIAQAFFPEGAAGPSMSYRVRVRGAPGYSLTTFRAGSRAVQYDSGRETWTALEWPGDRDNAGVALSVTPYQGAGPRPLAFDNPWGLFMILQPRAGAHVLEQTTKQLSIGWKPKAGQNLVKVDFASDDPRSPLSLVPFGGAPHKLFPLTAPSRISQLGASCAELSR